MAAASRRSFVKVVAELAPRGHAADDLIELVCKSGHRNAHSRARILRLNDGWCGKCGAGIGYDPLADARGPTREAPMPPPAAPVWSTGQFCDGVATPHPSMGHS
jgi:hypothetical protein